MIINFTSLLFLSCHRPSIPMLSLEEIREVGRHNQNQHAQAQIISIAMKIGANTTAITSLLSKIQGIGGRKEGVLS